MKLEFKTSDIIKSGQHKEQFQDLIVLYGQQYVNHDRANNKSILSNIANNEFTSDEVIQLAKNDVQITQWPLVIIAPVSILDKKVYTGLPDRTYTDEEGNEYVKKFKNWGEGQPKRYSNDKNYVALNVVIGGRYLNSDVFLIFDGKTDIQILSAKEWSDLQQNDSNWKTESEI